MIFYVVKTRKKYQAGMHSDDSKFEVIFTENSISLSNNLEIDTFLAKSIERP